MKENFGRFIDDIRKEYKWINVLFEEIPFGEEVTITIPESTKRFVVRTPLIGDIQYDTKIYKEFLQLALDELKAFKERKKETKI